jgi:integrase/recombinase XerC
MERADLIARYLTHVRVEKRLADRTVELYALDLEKLQANAVAANVALAAVTHAHIRRWVVQMHSGGRSGRGIALILSGWRGFYTWLGREGWVQSNPVQDVRTPKATKPVPSALSVDDAVRFANYTAPTRGSTLPAVDANPWLEARDAAIVELLYGCGLRLAELTGLDVRASATARGWLDLDSGDAHVLGKGEKQRSVPIGAKALLAVQQWLAVRTLLRAQVPGASHELGADADPAALFIGRNGTRLTSQSIWQRLQSRSLRAGMATPVHPHMLRHSFASHVLQSSGDIRAVQELLGHADISTTQAYTRLDFQHLAQIYDDTHPRAKLPS